jgi:hypothetical protein
MDMPVEIAVGSDIGSNRLEHGRKAAVRSLGANFRRLV